MPNSLRARVNKLAHKGELSKVDADRIRGALEKQIPKKPIYKHYEEKGEKPYIKITCPNGCGIQLSPVTENNNSYEHIYCNRCGQAIDWSDAE